ncbi:MAG: pyridoxal-phosphate dependent enzyme [Ahniella sp.]|nr:pyridoxal-phosphate dependent enzyme [Ahniella sp.]
MVPVMALPNFDHVREAAQRIAPWAVRTPVLRSDRLDALTGAKLWFKCEGLQRIGAFKFRGACNAVMALDDDLAASGVLTHSSGNHGAALGEAARIRGIPAHIVVPDGANPVKLANIEATGATLHACAPTLSAREQTAERVRIATGASLIHPYEHPLVIAGQGTAAMELLTEHPKLDDLLVPLGGGGLAAGTALTVSALSPTTRLTLVEPAGAADGKQGLESGERVTDWPVNTICDGLRTMLGVPNFVILRQHGAEVIAIDDTATLAAMAIAQRELRVQVEPSSAIVLAAVLAHPARFLGRHVGLILSGGNVA